MPEGHVVEAQARRLNAAFRGSVVAVDSPQGRFDAREVNGQTVKRVTAYGKRLFIEFENDVVVHIHLGLYGKWVIERGAPPAVKGEIRFRIASDAAFAELRGPSKCETITRRQMREIVQRSGVDPLRKNANPTATWQRVRQSSAPIGGLLMNQSLFAGVGNIYRVEVLFRAGISPFAPGRSLTDEQCDQIWRDLVELMRYGVKHGRIDTVKPEHTPNAMGRAPREDRHGGEVYVYRRAGQECFVCRSKVATAALQGRHVYWCDGCQKPS